MSVTNQITSTFHLVNDISVSAAMLTPLCTGLVFTVD